jgi:plasmid stability protein
MPDILIRNIAPNLKRNIEERAKRAGRSLSEEMKLLIRAGLERDRPTGQGTMNAYEAFREAFKDCLMTDEEHAEFERILEASRKQDWRDVPEFE